MKQGREVFVGFYDLSTKEAFNQLKLGKHEDKKLYELLNRAFDDLKKDPFMGIKIPKKLWPEEYVKKYDVTNLHKYDLPNGWRLIYTVQADSVQILAIILEWFDHTTYERRFKY